MTLRRPRAASLPVLLALLVLLVLAVRLVPGAADAAPAASDGHGAAGIGDPYFPRDGNGGYDVAHYTVRVSYDQATDELRGTTVVEATATQDLTRFDLDLLLPVASVTVDGARAAAAHRGGHELVVTPRHPLVAGQAFTTVVRYAGRPSALRYGGERSWLTDGQETVTMNEPHMAPWWFAANDHPLDKASFDVVVTARADRQVVSNGELVGRRVHGDLATTHWRAVEPMATYLAFFALGRYQVSSGTSHGLPWVAAVSRSVPQPQRRASMALMRRSPEVVRWLETLVGPYPFSTTGGLTTGLRVGFALENQTRPTYPVLGGKRVLTVVHELAHQWFGDAVAVRGWRDVWVNEGLATFFEIRWTEAHGGRSAQSWLEDAWASFSHDPAFWTLPVDDPGPRRLFDAPVYVRGAMTVQALRTRLGEERFATFLHTWVARHNGGNGSSAELEALASEVAGTDLTAFFDAWLRAPVPPAHTAANGFTA